MLSALKLEVSFAAATRFRWRLPAVRVLNSRPAPAESVLTTLPVPIPSTAAISLCVRPPHRPPHQALYSKSRAECDPNNPWKGWTMSDSAEKLRALTRRALFYHHRQGYHCNDEIGFAVSLFLTQGGNGEDVPGMTVWCS